MHNVKEKSIRVKGDLISIKGNIKSESPTSEFKSLLELQQNLSRLMGDASEESTEAPRRSFVFSQLKDLTEAEALIRVKERESDEVVTSDLARLIESETLMDGELVWYCKYFVDKFVDAGLEDDLHESDLKFIEAISNIANTLGANNGQD